MRKIGIPDGKVDSLHAEQEKMYTGKCVHEHYYDLCIAHIGELGVYKHISTSPP